MKITYPYFLGPTVVSLENECCITNSDETFASLMTDKNYPHLKFLVIVSASFPKASIYN